LVLTVVFFLVLMLVPVLFQWNSLSRP
jgi:hypothetical protein